jgi:RNA polymerase sigma-70 factor (ECF subfamily)
MASRFGVIHTPMSFFAINSPPSGHEPSVSQQAVVGSTHDTTTPALLPEPGREERDSDVRSVAPSGGSLGALMDEPAPVDDSGPLRNEQRLAEMVQTHYALLWRTVRRLGVPEAEVDDALQEVFLVSHRKIELVPRHQERAFLMAVAIRVASTRRRSLRRRRECTQGALAEQADPSPSPYDLAERKRARALLDEILDSMELKFRTVFVLFELEGLEIQQVADLLEIPAGTVASRLRRARELFQRAASRHQAQQMLPGGAR